MRLGKHLIEWASGVILLAASLASAQATVSGTVALNGGSGVVTDVTVQSDGAGNPTTHPNINGWYTLTNVELGLRRLTASLAGYITDTLHIMVTEAGYSEADMLLRRANPPAPTNLTVTVMYALRFDSLHWDISPDPLVDGYKVYRKLRDEGIFGLNQPVWGRTNIWTTDYLETDAIFDYVVTALDTNVAGSWAESEYSDTATLSFVHWPPSNLTANGNFDNKIRLAWQSPGSSGPSFRRGRSTLDDPWYLLYRDGVLRDSVAVTTPMYDDTGLVENVPHTYWVAALYDDGQVSPNSDTVTTRCNMAPGAPTNLTAAPVGPTQMRLRWDDPTVNADGTVCHDLAGMQVLRNGTLIAPNVAPGVQQYTDTPPDPTVPYMWTVRGFDGVPNIGPGDSVGARVLCPCQTEEYAWIDISTIGTNTGLTGDDQTLGPFNIGFPFRFYGQTHSSIYVCSNGWASFTDSTSTSYNNTHLPSPNISDPYCALMPLWDDLYLPAGGSVKYFADAANQRFIIAWLDVGPLTVEIVLDSNGGVTYQYRSVNDVSATIGVVNCDNTQAFEVCYNDSGFWCPHDSSAILFWGGPSQAIVGVVRHLGGTNPPLANAQVWVTGNMDTVISDNGGNYNLHVDPGTYTVHFRHPTHCDSARANIVVEPNVNTALNVSMRSPHCAPSVSSLTFVYHHGQNQQQAFTISNTGGGCPLAFSILDSVSWLGFNPQSGTVNPGATVPILTTMYADSLPPAGEWSTTAQIACNAPGTPFLIQVEVFTVGVTEKGGDLPKEFALHTNYPNPFNPTTLLPFDVPRTGRVEIVIYNMMGQEVARPVSGQYSAGRYQINFNAGELPSGVYLVKMRAGSFTAHGKMMLLK